jgi:uncharacterized protein YcfJ
MVGIKAIFSFLGIVLGLVTGLQLGVPRGWLVAIGASAGGTVGGGIGGCVFGWLLESSCQLTRKLSDRLSSKNRVLGDIFFCELYPDITDEIAFDRKPITCEIDGSFRRSADRR